MNREWFDNFFNWLDKEVDPHSGIWRRDVPVEITQQLGGAFHFYFLYEHFRRPLPYPERIIDTIIGAQREDGTFPDSPFPCWLELDAIYELNRAVRQTGYRRVEVLGAMKRTLGKIVERVMDSKYRDETMDDTHAMVAILSVLAELQQTLPGYLVTPRPLRLVLDRRPFI